MTDISAIKTVERVVEITHPATKEPLGIRVSLMSIDDPRMKKLKRQITDRRLQLEARGKHFKADDIDENRNALAFSAMTGWEWYGKDVSFKGNKPAFDRVSVYAVFDELTWFRDHIETEISETKDFFAVSETI